MNEDVGNPCSRSASGALGGPASRKKTLTPSVLIRRVKVRGTCELATEGTDLAVGTALAPARRLPPWATNFRRFIEYSRPPPNDPGYHYEKPVLVFYLFRYRIQEILRQDVRLWTLRALAIGASVLDPALAGEGMRISIKRQLKL